MRAHLIGQLSKGARDWLRDWARQQPLAEVTHSGYVRGRLEAWYRLGSNLQSVHCGRASITAAPEPPERLADFGERNLPGWRSLLVCGGPTAISWHRDHSHFEAEAVMINLGDAVFRERDSNVEEGLILSDGDVVRLDIKVLHMAEQKSTERFNFCFRRIKTEYLPSQRPQQVTF